MYPQKCLKNGCEWNSHVENPKQCPKCHSSNWREVKKNRSNYNEVKLLEIGQSVVLKWFIDENGNTLPDKNTYRNNLIKNYGVRSGKKFELKPVSAVEGIRITRIC